MSVETEAIQVAAVAAALVEDCTRPAAHREGGPSGRPSGRRWWDPIELVLSMIRDERLRQEEKWGNQHHTPLEWLMILAEEVEELAAVVTDPAEDGADARSLAVRQSLGAAGQEARKWIIEHPWPERQPQVIDEEGK